MRNALITSDQQPSKSESKNWLFYASCTWFLSYRMGFASTRLSTFGHRLSCCSVYLASSFILHKTQVGHRKVGFLPFYTCFSFTEICGEIFSSVQTCRFKLPGVSVLFVKMTSNVKAFQTDLTDISEVQILFHISAVNYFCDISK